MNNSYINNFLFPIFSHILGKIMHLRHAFVLQFAYVNNLCNNHKCLIWLLIIYATFQKSDSI